MRPAHEAYPSALRDAEQKLLDDRWNYGLKETKAPGGPTGVGISGGGIRSATFALGFFQGMAARGLVRYVDYLSTVSGGGYFGSFFGRLFTRNCVKSPRDAEQVLLGKSNHEIIDFLRENGRYLSPNGGGDSLFFGAALLRNWVAIQLILLIFLLTVFLGMQGLVVLVERYLGPIRALPLGGEKSEILLWWSHYTWLPAIVFVLCVFPLGWAYWLVEGKSVKRARIFPVAGALTVLVVCTLLALELETCELVVAARVGATLAGLAIGWWLLARWLCGASAPQEQGSLPLYRSHLQRNQLTLWLTWALVATGMLAVLALVDTLGQSIYVVLCSGISLGNWLTGLVGSIGLAGLGRWVALLFAKGPQGGRASLPYKLIAAMAAVLLMGGILVALDCASHAIAWAGDCPVQGPPAKLKELARPVGDPRVVVEAPAGTSMTLKLDPPPPLQQAAATGHKHPERHLRYLGLAFLGCLVMSVLFGQTWPFVNRSSHLPLYGSRLTRAYLGATNPERTKNARSVTDPLPGDDLELAEYWRLLRSTQERPTGAPIHLINVTINETVDAVSQVQQQDRKGLGFALGPNGWSVGVRHHLMFADLAAKTIGEVWPGPDQHRVFRLDTKPGAAFDGEILSLGNWLAISGAAFSTGTGMRTSLGISLLAGFANVRLGYWWDSGMEAQQGSGAKLSQKIESKIAKVFPVQMYLLDEFMARFPGTARQHWYLSDGGHFENMGGYELIRRRLPFMLILDGEMDVDYNFEGLANLVRKARLDFGAEIRFLTEPELNVAAGDCQARDFIGTLEQLRRGTWERKERTMGGERPMPAGALENESRAGRSLVYAALAQVTYDSDPSAHSWLLYVKPALTGCEPSDLEEYHGNHPDYPHESTMDQYFDEAQWESYRRLGEHIAARLFDQVDVLVPQAGKRTLIKHWDARFPAEPCAEQKPASG